MNLSNPILSPFSSRREHYCETSHVNHGRISSLHFNNFRLDHVYYLTAYPVVLEIFLHVQF